MHVAGPPRPILLAFLSLVALAGAFILTMASAAPALAATITVTNANDTTSTGDGVSLREAIASINYGADLNADVAAVGVYGTDDRIEFHIPGTGVKTIDVAADGLPSLDKPVTING